MAFECSVCIPGCREFAGKLVLPVGREVSSGLSLPGASLCLSSYLGKETVSQTISTTHNEVIPSFKQCPRV